MAPITPQRPLTTTTLSPRQGMSVEIATTITEDTMEVMTQVSFNIHGHGQIGAYVYIVHLSYGN